MRKDKKRYIFKMCCKKCSVSKNDLSDQATDIEFPSSQLLLTTIQKEYDCEYNRQTSIYNRTGIVISFIIALLFYGVMNLKVFKITELLSVKIEIISDLIPYIIIGIVYMGVIVAFCCSIYFGFAVLFTAGYQRLAFDCFVKENAKYSEDILAIGLVEKYAVVLKLLSKNNDIKVSRYEKLLTYVLASIVLLLICIVMNSIFL